MIIWRFTNGVFDNNFHGILNTLLLKLCQRLSPRRLSAHMRKSPEGLRLSGKKFEVVPQRGKKRGIEQFSKRPSK
jgi:hypothetical protein